MFKINTRSDVPIFEQIILEVGKFIALGILKPHDQLPTVRSLAREMGINPNTVSKAYHECEMRGLIYSHPGKGSFVSDTNHGVKELIDTTYDQLRSITVRLLELGERKTSIIKVIEEENL